MNKNDLEIEWPRANISSDGVLHYSKFQYSPQICDLMKSLMKESKLSLAQQKEVNWCLRTGSALVNIKRRNSQQIRQQNSAPSVVTNNANLSKRRSLAIILNSGAFERERYLSNVRNEDREKMKRSFQEIMEFGKLKSTVKNVKLEKKPFELKLPSKKEYFYSLINQIKERMTWLKEMEELGQGAKYRNAINHEIGERIKKIESLKLNKDIFIDDGNNQTRTNDECNEILAKIKSEQKKLNCKNSTNIIQNPEKSDNNTRHNLYTNNTNYKSNKINKVSLLRKI